jgi:hypothetical protein
MMFALMSVVTIIVICLRPASVHAQESTPQVDHGTCIKCHEDLYFLHDTGNWFCIRESPMCCVDCHGGNPTSLSKEEAHANRKAHPIINDDISKCRECHPAQCTERVAKFDQVAGISNVLIAVPYEPKPVPVSEQLPSQPPVINSVEFINWISAMEMITPVLLISLGLVIYLVHRRRQNKISKKES